MNTRTAALGATSAVAALAVIGLADAATEHDGLSVIDPAVANDVLQLRSSPLTLLAHAFTFAGSEVVVGAAALALLAFLVVRRSWHRAAVLAVSMGGSVFLTVALKLLVARHRPPTIDRLGPLDTSYSFPSGHTLNTTVLLAVVVWLLWGRVRHPFLMAATAAAAGLAVAASRVYLGYHWTTDVTASVLVALSWLTLVACGFRLLWPRIEARLTESGKRQVRARTLSS